MKKRYWLRGGIILVILFLLISSALTILFPPDPHSMVPVGYLPTFFGLGPFRIFTNFISFNDDFLLFGSSSGATLQLLIAVVTYFLVGSLLGWIYGKIKNKNIK